MENQKLQTYHSDFCKPVTSEAVSLIMRSKEFEQNYIVHRIKLKPIEISQDSRDMILKMMLEGKTFVQIADHTIMLNTISAIEPLPRKNQELRQKIEQMKKELYD